MDFNFGYEMWCFGMLIYEANNLTCDVSKEKKTQRLRKVVTLYRVIKNSLCT